MSSFTMRDAWLTVPHGLTSNPAKARRFAQECYFQECFSELEQTGAAWIQAIQNKGFVVFKPDAGAARCVERTLAIFEENGLRPIYSTLHQFTRHSFRELWRYEFNIATYERYSAVDALLCRYPSLFVMFERIPGRRVSSDSLAVFIDKWKGPSLSIQRRADHLRTRIGAKNGVLNYIHTPEEPIDVVRELGVLFDTKIRRHIYQLLTQDENSSVKIDTGRFYNEIPAHCLEFEEVRRKVLLQNNSTRVTDLIEKGCKAIDFEAFCADFASVHVNINYWDAITLYVTHREFVVDGVQPILEFERQTALSAS